MTREEKARENRIRRWAREKDLMQGNHVHENGILTIREDI
jgi:hypothetical protein